MSEAAPSPRTRLERRPERADYDPATVAAILDDGFLCHVAFALDGQPIAIPTVYARSGDQLYLHGSPANRMLHALADGIEACVCVTHVDGLVLARSAFHQSVNYRSVVLFGRAAEVEDPDEKRAALEAIVAQVIPHRLAEIRRPSRQEVRKTKVLRLPIGEASAKVRTGPPVEEEEDYALPCWAGVIPLRTRADPPVPDPRLAAGIEPPAYALAYRGSGR